MVVKPCALVDGVCADDYKGVAIVTALQGPVDWPAIAAQYQAEVSV